MWATLLFWIVLDRLTIVFGIYDDGLNDLAQWRRCQCLDKLFHRSNQLFLVVLISISFAAFFLGNAEFMDKIVF